MEIQNNPSEIPCFTIASLLRMGTAVPNYNRQLIARCDSAMETFRFPCRIDAIIISVCVEGECRICSDLREYTLTKGSMFVCSPKNILQVRSSRDFRSDVLVVAPELLRETHINLKNMMPLFIEYGSRPCFPLPDTDRMALHHLIAQIETETQMTPETAFTAEIVQSLVSASIAKIGDIFVRYGQGQSAPDRTRRNRGEEYFKEFMQLLGAHYKQERTVSFYARKMCITPKYLTTLIKRLSDKSVSDWIDDYVILESKTLLKYSDMSIQEVAYYLNFPNQSFFGSYFKRNTGMSPSQYKLQ